MKRFVICLLIGSLLAGCARLRPDMSYVSPSITADDARTLAAGAARYLSGPLPPAATTLVIAPPAAGQPDALTAAMVEQFRATGYGVVQVQSGGREAPPVNGVALRYLASPLDGGVLLRLQYQGKEAARFYPRGGSGALVEAAPFMVRLAGQ